MSDDFRSFQRKCWPALLTNTRGHMGSYGLMSNHVASHGLMRIGGTQLLWSSKLASDWQEKLSEAPKPEKTTEVAGGQMMRNVTRQQERIEWTRIKIAAASLNLSISLSIYAAS